MLHLPLLLLADAVYLLVLVVALPWLIWRAVFRGKYRRHVMERFGGVPRRPADAKPLIWLHGVSVGEVIATQPLVKALQAALPTHEIAISASTETGRATAAQLYPQLCTFQYPQDFSWACWRALRRMRPAVVLSMELEIWPNFARVCRWMRIPLMVVNGRMTDRSCRGYSRFRWLIGSMFRGLRLVCAQTDAWAANFARAGVPSDRVQVTGSVKYDSLDLNAGAISRERNAWREKLGVGSNLLWVAGSTHPPEHEAVLRAWQTLRAEGLPVQLLLVPRHPEKPDPWSFMQRAAIPHVRQSELSDDVPQSADAVIVGDVMGTLAKLYAAADVAFVGKSLLAGKAGGGQNPLEPAALGVPVVFGPHMRNFAAPAADLLARGGAVQAEDEAALVATLRRLISDAEHRRDVGTAARAAVDAGRGAAARTAAAVVAALG